MGSCGARAEAEAAEAKGRTVQAEGKAAEAEAELTRCSTVPVVVGKTVVGKWSRELRRKMTSHTGPGGRRKRRRAEPSPPRR